MATAPNADVDRIFTFWFDDTKPIERWFKRSDAFDAEIKSQFNDLTAKARTSNLDSWQDTPRSTLALIILLDQFSRNIYRGTPDAFSGDAKAVTVASRAICKGFDKELPLIQQMFVYLPLMHEESLLAQIASKAYFEGFASRCEMDDKLKEYAEKTVWATQLHMDIILRFGRYPGRNKAMGRENTEEERKWLKEHPEGM